MSKDKPESKKIRVMPKDDVSIRGTIYERLNSDSINKSQKPKKDTKEEK